MKIFHRYMMVLLKTMKEKYNTSEEEAEKNYR